MGYPRKFFKFTQLITFLFFISCTSEDPGTDDTVPENTEPVITLDIYIDEMRPLQISSLYLSDIDLERSTYNGNIDEEEIIFTRISKNTLAFSVPIDIESGSNDLFIEINDKTYMVELQVLDNIYFDNPQTVFDNYRDELLNDDWLGIQQNDLSEAVQTFNSLTEEEKRIAAQFILNNSEGFFAVTENLKNLYSDLPNYQAQSNIYRNASNSCKSLCVVGATAAVLGGIISSPVIVAAGVGVIAGLAVDKAYKLLKPRTTKLLEKTNIALEMVYGIGYNRMAYITELVYDAANERILNKTQELPDVIELRQKESLTFEVQVVNTPIVSNVYRQEFAEVNELMNQIDRMVETFENVHTFPSLRTENTLEPAESIDDFSYSINNEDVETEGLSGSAQAMSISFKSDKLEDQDFTLTLSYENPQGFVSEISQGIKLLATSYNVANRNGLGIGIPLKLFNTQERYLRLLDLEGNSMENFDSNKLEIRNISNDDINLLLSGSDNQLAEFSIQPLGDIVEADFSFDLYYDNELVRSIDANFQQIKNGFYIGSDFYPTPYGYVADYWGDDEDLEECDYRFFVVWLMSAPYEEFSFEEDDVLSLQFMIEKDHELLKEGVYTRDRWEINCRSMYVDGGASVEGTEYVFGSGSLTLDNYGQEQSLLNIDFEVQNLNTENITQLIGSYDGIIERNIIEIPTD